MNFPILNNQISLGLTIPMFNEEGAAEQVLQQTMYVLRKAKIPFQLAVVNNGSTDATGMIIDKLSTQHAEIIPVHFTTNQGYGGGILSGMRALEPQNLDCIGWMWEMDKSYQLFCPNWCKPVMRDSIWQKHNVQNEKMDGYARSFPKDMPLR